MRERLFLKPSNHWFVYGGGITSFVLPVKMGKTKILSVSDQNVNACLADANTTTNSC
jgi:hypothetical protein